MKQEKKGLVGAGSGGYRGSLYIKRPQSAEQAEMWSPGDSLVGQGAHKNSKMPKADHW